MFLVRLDIFSNLFVRPDRHKLIADLFKLMPPKKSATKRKVDEICLNLNQILFKQF